ncbi:MAG: hypothetical protein JOZ81_29580, partial [Chloroflexi bacterium]|nr:hypothetical protein [Chloroflexota bacterium]
MPWSVAKCIVAVVLCGACAVAPSAVRTAEPTAVEATRTTDRAATVEATRTAERAATVEATLAPAATVENAAVQTSTSSVEQSVQTVFKRMTLEQKVGQVFMLGFDGTRLNDTNRALVHDLHLGGVTLFGRNVENGLQVRQLTADLQSVADPVPLFVSADQEGGLVVRVTEGATVFPGNMAVGATHDPELAGEVARASASELLAMGINMDLAPVVDVNTNPLNPVIGVRSFGSDVHLVSDTSSQTVQSLQGTGVSAVAK